MRRVRILAPALLAMICQTAPAQVAEKANSGYKTAEGRERVAKTLAAPDRDAKQRPQELVDHMGLKPGITVADVGTGVGYMLPYLSRAVGPSGKVLAEDIADDFLAKAKAKAAADMLANVSFVKGSEVSPNLPDGQVDVELALDSYHHYDYPEKMLAALHKSLKKGGRLVIVEYYKRPNAMPTGNAMEHIRADEPEVIKEIEASHFKLLSKREHIKDSQYMLIFEKK
jgi:ubiquinone/menaquinone biosynthesis C-methylase UbiE